MSDKCCKDEMHGRCCCNCRFHLRDHHHCTTAGDDIKPAANDCKCSVPKGWVCAPPEFPVVYSGWSEHGMCEMHDYAEGAKP